VSGTFFAVLLAAERVIAKKYLTPFLRRSVGAGGPASGAGTQVGAARFRGLRP